MPSHLLKSTPVENTPPVTVLPPNIVEIEVDFDMEHVDIHYEFPIINKDDLDEAQNCCPQPDPKVDVELCTSPTKSGKKGKVLKKGAKEGDSAKTPSSRKAKQEHEVKLKLPEPFCRVIDNYSIEEAPQRHNNAYIRYIERTPEELADLVEYDLDEMDFEWLKIVNDERSKERLQPVSAEVMEFVMDRLEKESYFQMQSSGIEQGPIIDDDAVCCICMDGECQNANAILFCDMCNLAVHQECYGVPYIPEGQWLCRRCYLSPSIAVDCVLCPNKGGAFKQTECKRWAHVVCAIWIPEVCFANTVFLEPIDNISSIPPARWKLCCFICKQKGVGACIQCYKSNCYTAFHVTCAQQAGLCMRMETVRLSSGVTVKKTAFCDPHAPPDFIAERDSGSPTARQKLKQIRKVLAEKRCAAPVVSVPTIPPEQLSQISSAVTLTRKNQFMKRVIAYWKLKRMSRNGVPLLRRLQIASNTSNSVNKSSRKIDVTQLESSMKDYAEITRVRQDLEKSRLLCELTRKREKLKREDIYVKCQVWDMRIQPFNYFLASIVDELSLKDAQSIFTQPVDPEHVPDYLTVVTSPMDLSTMREKIFEFVYETVDDLQKDFQLMIDNCLLYNSRDTVFYRAALKMQEYGGIVFREAKRRYSTIGFEPPGTMTDSPPAGYLAAPPIIDEVQLAVEIEEMLENKSRYNLTYEEHVKFLEDVLDKSLNLSHPLSRKKKFLRIKNEMVRLKKRKKLLDSGGLASGPVGGDTSSVDEDEVAPSPSIFGGELVDSSGEDGESGAKGFTGSKYSSIRSRLRSTDNELVQQQQNLQNQPYRLLRRLSRSSDLVTSGSTLSPDINEMIAGSRNIVINPPKLFSPTTSVSSQNSRRGRPPKPIVPRSRGGRAKLSIRGAASTVRQARTLQTSRKGSLRARGRGRRGVKPLRRSTRVVNQQILAQQKHSNSPEKEEEEENKKGSRRGSPIGRNVSPRASRHASPTHLNIPKGQQPQVAVGQPSRKSQQRQIPSRQPSPILGSPMKPHQLYMHTKPQPTLLLPQPLPKARQIRGKQIKTTIGHVQMPILVPQTLTTMEAAAKSIVCEDKRPRLPIKANIPLVVAKQESAKKNARGGASRVLKRDLPGTSMNASTPKSPPKNKISPQRKIKGPASAVGKRKKATEKLNGPHLYINPGEVVADVSKKEKEEKSKGPPPLTNGVLMPGTPGKVASPGKKRPRRGATVATSSHGANPNIGNYSSSLVGSSLFHNTPGGLHIKKADSFSVYRSGGDHDINSYSEGESGNDDDEEDDEMEEEEGDEDEDDEEGELDDDDESGSEEEPGEPSEPKDCSSDEDDNNEEEGDDTSDSDNSSSDSDSSATSSSSLSSTTSGSTASKASSSSSITTPKHFHPTKNRKRRNSSGTHSQRQVQLSTSERVVASPSRTVRQQLASPTISSTTTNNNNNVLCNNKERDYFENVGLSQSGQSGGNQVGSIGNAETPNAGPL